MQLQICNLKPLTNPIAKFIFSMKFPEWGLTLHNFCYFEKSDGSYWIGSPFKEYTNKNGEKSKFQLAYFEKDQKHVIEKLVKEYIQKNVHSERIEEEYIPF